MKKITEKEGYEAMIHMLHFYWEYTGSRDLTDILSGGVYALNMDEPIDYSFMDYWLNAVDKVKNGESPLRINLTDTCPAD